MHFSRNRMALNYCQIQNGSVSKQNLSINQSVGRHYVLTVCMTFNIPLYFLCIQILITIKVTTVFTMTISLGK